MFSFYQLYFFLANLDYSNLFFFTYFWLYYANLWFQTNYLAWKRQKAPQHYWRDYCTFTFGTQVNHLIFWYFHQISEEESSSGNPLRNEVGRDLGKLCNATVSIHGSVLQRHFKQGNPKKTTTFHNLTVLAVMIFYNTINSKTNIK